MNTKYISSSVLKTSEFSWVRSTNKNFDVFNSRDEIYFVFTKKSKYSFYFILFRRFTVNQFVNHASSRITKRRQRSICDRLPGSIYMIYSHQDLQIERNLFSVKVRDKWRHKRRHNLLMTLRSIVYMHCLTHRSGRCWISKSKNFSKCELFWYQNVPHVLTKKMTTYNWCFCSQIREL